MSRSPLVSAVGAVDWAELRSTYESGEIVRDIVLSLASRDETEVRWAWEQIEETVLQHQGTVLAGHRGRGSLPMSDRPGRDEPLAGRTDS